MAKANVRRRTLIGAVALAAFAIWSSDFLMFEAPGKLADSAYRHLGRRMRKQQQIRFLVSFGEAHPRELIGRTPIHAPGTEISRGRSGRARRFNGSTHTYMESAVTWADLGERYTLSLWMKANPDARDQTIWYANNASTEIGFQLRDGQMVFHIPSGAPVGKSIAYPFTKYGRFVHLAAVVEGAGGAAHLYEDGVLKGSVQLEDVAMLPHNIEFGKFRWCAVIAPFHGSLDEAVAWRRALTPREIASLARTRLPLPLAKAPVSYVLWRLLQAGSTTPATTRKILDLFNPGLHGSRLAATRLPEINLYLSASDQRHFINGHGRSLAAGRRLESASQPRRILTQYARQTVAAKLWLDGSSGNYATTRRPAYILQLPTEAPFNNVSLVRLLPPEAFADSLPRLAQWDANSSRQSPTNILCRLSINGIAKGVYRYESYEQCGIDPNDPIDILHKPPSYSSSWEMLFQKDFEERRTNSATLTAAETGMRLEQMRRILQCDRFHPWSSREWRWRIRRALQYAPENAASEPPGELAILGDNPAPAFIVGDLDLSVLRTGGYLCQSSRPDIINGDGRVTRPAGNTPVDVELEIRKAVAHAPTIAYRKFRVMPVARRLPALMLYFREPANPNRRVDFHGLYYEPDETMPPQPLTGGQATGGGLKYRGNTSFWKSRRKSLSLRFDEPEQLVGEHANHYLYLLNGYSDSTKLRNKLAYDLFRSWGTADSPRHAPMVAWAEVFVNGRYCGIYEMCARVDGEMLGYAEKPLDQYAVLYKIHPDKKLFTRPQSSGAIQAFPRLKLEVRAEPLNDLLAFTSQSSPEEFARRIGDWIDLDNAIDFLLLLNFSCNVDGRVTNFYLARDGAKGDRFFFIPWDYDHTFEGRSFWLSNHLFDRLWNEVPDFRVRTGARWRELRKGILADAAVSQRIQAMADQLTAAMPWEYELMEVSAFPSHAAAVGQLHQYVLKNLHALDQRFQQ